MSATIAWRAAVLAALATLADAHDLFAHVPATRAFDDVRAMAVSGRSPKPTPPPALHEYLRRASATNSKSVPTALIAADNTCGYIDGSAGAPYACYNTAAFCVLYTSSALGPGRVACCNASSCNYRLGCVDYNDYFSNKCDDGCKADVYTAKCTSLSLQYCNTVTYTDGIMDYFCGSLPISTPQLLISTFKGQTSGGSFTEFALTGTASSLQSNFPSNTASSTGTTSTGEDGSPAPTSTGNSDGDNSSNDNSNKKSKSAPIGAIVGGVVGGVAALGIVAIALFLFLRKKKNKDAGKESPANQATPQMYQGGPPPQAGSHQSYYNPNYGAQQPQYGQQPTSPYNGPPSGGYYPQQGDGASHASYGYQGAMSGTTDPRTGQPSMSPKDSHLSGSPQPPQAHQSPPLGGYQQNTLHEAPSSYSDHHRGEMHELS